MESFSAYLKEIGRYPLLTKDQEILLARQVQNWVTTENPTLQQRKRGERAYKKLLNCNLRLVVSIAKRYTKNCRRTELFDLVQEGNMGLAHGIKKFDPERGYALSTYVYWWIRQSITRYIGTYDRVIRLPSHAVEMLTKLRHWTPIFEHTHGRKPTLEECAEFCKTNPTRMREYLDRRNDAVSLDSPVNGIDDNVFLVDSVSADTDVFEDVAVDIDIERLAALMGRLQPRERLVLEKMFGIGTGEPMTFQALAKEMGVCREKARNIYHRALRKLQTFRKSGLS
jgi:RNA polymerase nonessential primary-like sigma factor